MPLPVIRRYECKTQAPLRSAAQPMLMAALEPTSSSLENFKIILEFTSECPSQPAASEDLHNHDHVDAIFRQPQTAELYTKHSLDSYLC